MNGERWEREEKQQPRTTINGCLIAHAIYPTKCMWENGNKYKKLLLVYYAAYTLYTVQHQRQHRRRRDGGGDDGGDDDDDSSASGSSIQMVIWFSMLHHSPSPAFLLLLRRRRRHCRRRFLHHHTVCVGYCFDSVVCFVLLVGVHVCMCVCVVGTLSKWTYLYNRIIRVKLIDDILWHTHMHIRTPSHIHSKHWDIEFWTKTIVRLREKRWHHMQNKRNENNWRKVFGRNSDERK